MYLPSTLRVASLGFRLDAQMPMKKYLVGMGLQEDNNL